MNDKIKNISDKVDKFIDFVSPIAGAVFPQTQIPLVIARDLLENVKNIDNKLNDDLVFGLSEISLIIDEVIYNLKNKKEVDINKLQSVSKNLKIIDSSLDNFYKLIS